MRNRAHAEIPKELLSQDRVFMRMHPTGPRTAGKRLIATGIALTAFAAARFAGVPAASIAAPLTRPLVTSLAEAREGSRPEPYAAVGAFGPRDSRLGVSLPNPGSPLTGPIFKDAMKQASPWSSSSALRLNASGNILRRVSRAVRENHGHYVRRAEFPTRSERRVRRSDRT